MTQSTNEEDGAKKKWSSRGRKLETLEGHTGAVLALARMSETTLISGSADNTLIAWESDTGTQITKLGKTSACPTRAL